MTSLPQTPSPFRSRRIRRNLSSLPETLAWLDAEAARLGLTPSQVVDSLVREHLPDGAHENSTNHGTQVAAH